MTVTLTSTGVNLDLAHMGHDAISVLDIAHHLAQINRFNGACRRPYSVAEHSLMVCEILEREQGERRPLVLLAALMHDAHEAFCTDLPQPMKQLIGRPWSREEERIQGSVLLRFGLADAFADNEAAITWADLTALSAEKRALMPTTPGPWRVEITHPAVGWIDFEQQARFAWTDWRQAFLDRFAELTFAHTLQLAPTA